MNLQLKQQLSDFIRHQQDSHLYRRRWCHHDAQDVYLQHAGHTYLSFCSNDYLGLANHVDIKQHLQQAVQHYGFGAGASHLVTGHQQAHHDLEQHLARLTQRQQALLFSTGYMANLGVITALLNRHDAIFIDKLNHASLIDAALLSRAQLHRYRHGDMAHLERQLKHSHAKHKLIATDGVFSMEGDIAPLDDIADLARKYQAWLMVDDAHGFGVLGKHGGGSLAHFGLDAEAVPILMGTLGKAVGGFGAFVAGDALLIDYLIQTARPYIYTTALPAAWAVAMQHSLELLEHADAQRLHLTELIHYFKTLTAANNIAIMPSVTPIQGILCQQPDKALAASQALYQQGILVTAIRPPTVPKNTARLRITLSANHQLSDIQRLVTALTRVFATPL